MKYKKWLIAGIIFFLISLVIGFFGPMWGIYNAFSAIKSNEGAAGIGVVISALNEALITTVVSVFGFLIGLILITIGAIKGYRTNNSQN